MHYKSGTPAQLGDIVHGKGYNIPHEIIGTVVGLTAGTSACNIQVATCKTTAVEGVENLYGIGMFNAGSVYDSVTHTRSTPKLFRTEPYTEYGACADFELLHRPQK